MRGVGGVRLGVFVDMKGLRYGKVEKGAGGGCRCLFFVWGGRQDVCGGLRRFWGGVCGGFWRYGACGIYKKQGEAGGAA